MNFRNLRLYRRLPFILFLAAGLGTVGFVSTATADPSQARPAAVVTRILGLANFEASYTAGPRQLQPFQVLNVGEMLIVKEGYVVLVCSDDYAVRLTAPMTWRLSAEGCRQLGKKVPGLYAGLAPRLGRSSSLEMAAVVEGEVRDPRAIGEILLSPRDTAVTTPRPNLYWRRIGGARQYQIEIPGLGEEVWLAAESVNCGTQAEWPGLEVCTASFPAGFSDLQPGRVVYPRIGFLKGLSGSPQQEDYRATFVLLPAADAHAIEGRIAALAGLPASERDVLAGSIYAAAGLRSAAIQALRRALEVRATPEDRLSLGRLYQESGLPSFAETEFKSAFSAPMAAEIVKAAAAWDLARIAYAGGRFEHARERARQASALFHSLGFKEEEAAAKDLVRRAGERAVNQASSKQND